MKIKLNQFWGVSKHADKNIKSNPEALQERSSESWHLCRIEIALSGSAQKCVLIFLFHGNMEWDSAQK